VLRFNDDGTSTLSYISIGGQIEAYFMMQGTPKEIIATYHSIIGDPYLPPFWAMGW
jgi:lysosomal alpha-glucosidase